MVTVVVIFAVLGHCSCHLEKDVPGTMPPHASASLRSFLETIFVWTKCKLTSKMLSLFSKNIILKGK